MRRVRSGGECGAPREGRGGKWASSYILPPVIPPVLLPEPVLVLASRVDWILVGFCVECFPRHYSAEAFPGTGEI